MPNTPKSCVPGATSSRQLLSCRTLSPQNVGQLVIVHWIRVSTPPGCQTPCLHGSSTAMPYLKKAYIMTRDNHLQSFLRYIKGFWRRCRVHWRVATSTIGICDHSQQPIHWVFRTLPMIGSHPWCWYRIPATLSRWPPWPPNVTV